MQQDTDNDRIQQHYDEEFDRSAVASKLKDMEQSTSAGNLDEEHNTQPARNMLKDKEESSDPTKATPFTNNVSEQGGKKPNIKDMMSKLSVKKKAATISLVLALFGAGSLPFLGTAALPFAIAGNLNANALSHGMQSYMEDLLGVSIFGLKGKTTASFDGDKIGGLTDSQIKELKSNGVTLQPEDGLTNKAGKKTFSSMTIDGTKVSSKADLSDLIRSKPSTVSKILVTKTPLWKAAKSATSLAYSSAIRAIRNPQLKGTTIEEKNKNFVADATGGGGAGNANVVAELTDDMEDADKTTATENAEGMNKGIQEDLEAAKKSVEAGTPLEDPSNNGNLKAAIVDKLEAGGGIDANINKLAEGTSVGSKIWSYVNALGPLDLVCSIYQTAHTATILARGVIMYNAMRTAIYFVSLVEKYKAGDGQSMEDMEYFMNILQKRDPKTNQAFDQSAAAQFIFTGKINDTPPTISAVGGAGIKAFYSTLLAIHSTVGGGDAKLGREAMRNACNIITNLGVQVGVTLGSLVVGFFTGGTSTALGGVSVSLIRDSLVAGAKKIATGIAEKVGKDIAEKGVLGMLKSNAWKGFKGAWNNLDVWGKTGILLAGVGTFAMPYVVEALTGGDILNALSNGFDFTEMAIAGFNDFDYRTAIANGGLLMSIPKAQAYYNDTYQPAQQTYIASLQQEAKKTPFDYKNQYSALGSIVTNFGTKFGYSSFTTPASMLSSIMSLPAKLPTMFTPSAGAASARDFQAISDYVNNEAYTGQNLALQVTGSPFAGYNHVHSFEEVLEQLGGTEISITESAATSTTTDTTGSSSTKVKLEIVPGSALDTYRKECHNSERTQTDPQFQNDDGSDGLSIECGVGTGEGGADGAKYNSLYSDAITYLTAYNPSNEPVATAGATTGNNTSSTPPGTCPDGTNIVNEISIGWDKDNGGAETPITLCKIPNTSAQINPGWTDSRYKGTSSLGISELVVNSEAASSLLEISKKYTTEKGGKLSGSVAYRSVYEQCSFFMADSAGKVRNTPSSEKEKGYYSKYCSPNTSWLKYPVGKWSTPVVVSNHMMGRSVDFTEPSKTWMKQCVTSSSNNRCYGFYDDVLQSGGGDAPHFTYKP